MSVRTFTAAILSLLAMLATSPRADAADAGLNPRLVIMPPRQDRGMEIDEIDRQKYVQELFAAIAQAGEFNYQLGVPLDRDELANLDEGRADVVGPVPLVEAKIRNLSMTAPFLVARGAAFYRVGAPRLNAPELLKGRNVGVAMWGAGQQWCMERDIPVLPQESLKKAMEELAAGRLDVVITSEISGNMEIERLTLRNIEHATLRGGEILRSYAFATKPQDEALRKRIDKGLALVKSSGAADALYARYIQKYQPRDSGPTVSLAVVIWIGALVLAACALGILAFMAQRKRLARRSRDLAESKERYRLMADNVAGVSYCCLVQDDGRRVLLSTNVLYPEWRERFPALQNEAGLEEGLLHGAHGDDVERLKAGLNLARETLEPVEIEFRLPDGQGEPRWILARAFAQQVPHGVVWQFILQDETDQRRLAASLHETEVKFKEIVEHCHDGILAASCPAGVILEANAAAAAALGCGRAELLGRSISAVLPQLPDAVLDSLRSAIELKVRHEPAGSSPRHLEARLKPVRLAGKGAVLVLLRDVTETEIVAQERVRLEMEIARTQKLEGLGVMAGGIAHDFNNILVGILGNLSIVARQVEGDSAAVEIVRAVQKAASRAADLTSKLLAYSGGATIERRATDLRQLLTDSRDMLAIAAGRGAVLTIEAPTEGVVISGDSIQIEQVLVNLVRNAGESISHDEGTVKLSLQSVVLDGTRPAGLVGAEVPRGGAYAQVSVADNGGGIAPEIMHSIFEPFVTTKFAGRGLGLAASLGIVRAHRGSVCMHTGPSGTEFRILLPLAAGQVDQVLESKPRRQPLPVTFNRSVMVVDDEKLVRETARAMLRALKAATIAVESGDEALEALRSGPAPDCVLLDLTMPGKDGLKTLQEIRTFLPHLPVILCSGFTELSLSPRLAADPQASFLAKPYTLDELSNQLDAALHGPSFPANQS